MKRARLGLASALGGLAGVLSYGGQHLYTRVDGATLLAPTDNAPIAFFWRMGLVALHVSLVALVVYLGTGEARSRRLLGWVPLLVCLVVPVSLAMVVWP